MKIDWIMVLAVLAWTAYAVLVVTIGRTYLRRMASARRQLRATRHVTAAPTTVDGRAG